MWLIWLLVLGLTVAAVALTVLVWWLFKRRRRGDTRAEFRQELVEHLERLGLEQVWQTPFYETDIFGVEGVINELQLKAELWDGGAEGFLRVTAHFPRALRQGLRLRKRNRRWMEQWWRMEAVSTGDERFDEAFQSFAHQEHQERALEVLMPGVRHQLFQLGKEVDELEMGENSLHIFVGRVLESREVARLVEKTLRAAREVFARVSEVGPLMGVTNTEYERISTEPLGRDAVQTDQFETEGLPDGSDSGESSRSTDPG